MSMFTQQAITGQCACPPPINLFDSLATHRRSLKASRVCRPNKPAFQRTLNSLSTLLSCRYSSCSVVRASEASFNSAGSYYYKYDRVASFANHLIASLQSEAAV